MERARILIHAIIFLNRGSQNEPRTGVDGSIFWIGRKPGCEVSMAAHGEQEMSVWNGHFACTCYHPLFVFN